MGCIGSKLIQFQFFKNFDQLQESKLELQN